MEFLSGYRTYLGIIIAVAPSVAGLFGFDLSPQFGEEVSSLVAEGVTLLGGILAFYGRAKATVPGLLVKK